MNTLMAASDHWARTVAPTLPTDAQNPFEVARCSAEFMAERAGVDHIDIAFMLGSGWQGTADLLGPTKAEFSAHLLTGSDVSAVPGHDATIRVITLFNQPGKYGLILPRTHFYQHRDIQAVAHPVRTAAALGATSVVLTNGCGSVNPDWAPGQVVAIKDHINLTGMSPLEGATFVDLVDAYSPHLRDVVHQVDPSIPEGVYVQFPGPHYETPAEVQMAARIGGDLVGMSTALETIAAREAGMHVLGLSLVTNPAAGIGSDGLNHQEVLKAGQDAAPRISQLLADVARAMTRELAA